MILMLGQDQVVDENIFLVWWATSFANDVVGEERLELSSLAAPAPKAGVDTNFTTRP